MFGLQLQCCIQPVQNWSEYEFLLQSLNHFVCTCHSCRYRAITPLMVKSHSLPWIMLLPLQSGLSLGTLREGLTQMRLAGIVKTRTRTWEAANCIILRFLSKIIIWILIFFPNTFALYCTQCSVNKMLASVSELTPISVESLKFQTAHLDTSLLTFLSFNIESMQCRRLTVMLQQIRKTTDGRSLCRVVFVCFLTA